MAWFQHTAARRRLHAQIEAAERYDAVSTHSRAEAAANYTDVIHQALDVSTHSRAEAAAMGPV